MRRSLFLAMLAAIFSGCATTSTTAMSGEERFDRAQEAVKDWHPYASASAMKLMDEYGAPDQIESDRLIWRNTGPWDKITVWDTENFYSAAAGSDDMEQTLGYDVPQDKRADLAAFSDKLAVSDDGRQLSVRGSSEELDFLTLNLANEIVRGVRSPEDARAFYDRIAKLAQAGKSSPYTQRLLFSNSRVMLPRGSEERSDFLTAPLSIWDY
jgi:hypothetical protein